MQSSVFREEILSVRSKKEFDRLAIRVFRFQAEQNKVYANYIAALKIDVNSVTTIKQIPFLPIEFFKTHRIVTDDFQEQVVFESSGTTGAITSRHYVKDIKWYEQIFLQNFELFYGNPRDYCILALLPSYLERTGSSLIVMVQGLTEKSEHENSGFFLRNYEDLYLKLCENEKKGSKTILLGVTFGLLDFAEKFNAELSNTIVMETGGMKGMRDELTREEIADFLKRNFNVHNIHSEYGMTELMSQAYSKGEGVFSCPPWMRILVRELNDPLVTRTEGRGVLNIIDLANIDSCAFIATQDVGEVLDDMSFKVNGRLDQSDIRGCNLLVL